MGSITNLPKGAMLREEFAGRIDKPGAWTHGKLVRFSRYSAMCSKGYKTDYQHVATEFLVLRIQGERTYCRMYSGTKLAKAAAIFAGWKSDLLPYMDQRPEDHPDYPFGKVQTWSGLDV